MCLALLLAAVGQPAPAEPASCDRSPGQPEQEACARALLDRAETDLDGVYEALLAQLRERDLEDGTDLEAALRDGQQAWLRFRDLTCAAEAAMKAEPERRPAYELSCRQMLTVMRRDDFQNFGQ